MPDRPLLVTSDPDLLDDLLRICAAAGAEARVANDVAAARGAWTEAPVVVLGDELSRSALASGLPRRGDLLLVSRDLDDAEVWSRAAALGAESVVLLPRAQSLLVERLTAACGEPSAGAVTVAVVGGRGGAGASPLSCALAVTAAGSGWRTLLVDADALGGGLDLVLGCEDAPGLRWPDIGAVGGAISASALRSALPTVDGLHLLSWDRGDEHVVSAATARAVLAAARPVHELLVVDLPRRVDAAAEVVLVAADLVLLVVPTEVRAVAAAARVAAYAGLLARDIRVVARGPAPSGLTPELVAERLGLPLAGRLKPEPGLARSLERGEPPARSGRGPLADLCRSLLGDLPGRGREAA
ncbi:MAG: hypothetical protein LH461_06615 [Spirochaetaceae bacterium]|nr:hypothetical protein [Spirochaetaceae bacterium]